MTKNIKICVIGSINLDFIIKSKTLPTKGETIANGTFSTMPGGKGGNVAMVAKRLGADVDILACVGDDIYADEALKYIKDEGVNLSAVKTLSDKATGVAFINVAEDGENQISVASGANMAFTPADLGQITADAIITQFEIPFEVVSKAVRNTQSFTCVNASPIGPELSGILPHIDLLIVNEGEYEAYKKELEAYTGLLAITLGSKGAKLLLAGEEIAAASPPKIDVVDTTGAGDTFAAALTVGLMEKMNPQAALDFACIAGALATTKLGTQSSAPHRSDVDSRL